MRVVMWPCPMSISINKALHIRFLENGSEMLCLWMWTWSHDHSQEPRWLSMYSWIVDIAISCSCMFVLFAIAACFFAFVTDSLPVYSGFNDEYNELVSQLLSPFLIILSVCSNHLGSSTDSNLFRCLLFTGSAQFAPFTTLPL